jgi:hypothetical protein
MKYIPFICLILTISGCEDDTRLVETNTAKIDYYIDSFQQTGNIFVPQSRVKYDYDDAGHVKQYTVLSYDAQSGNYFTSQYFMLTWSGKQLSSIKGYLTNVVSPYIEYQYTFSGSQIAKISQLDGTGKNTAQASFEYISDDSVAVNYSFSNGNGFQYAFHRVKNNIISDKTTRSTQTCSEGVYAYDDKHNPFSGLGYVDFSLSNFSANNKLSENVNYKGCAFPELIPISYEYTYNAGGYPLTVITTYKSNGTASAKAKREFFYK